MKNTLSENSVVYIKDGREHCAIWECLNDGNLFFEDGEVSVLRKIEEIYTDVCKVTDTYKNIGEKGNFVFVLDVAVGYKADFTLVPAVSYDGNKFGNNGDPKGLYCDGSPWIFGYSRTSLPAATITEGNIEGNRICTGVFSSTEDRSSLISSCSIYEDESGITHQRIYRPEIEAPKTYSGAGGYSEAMYDSIMLEANEEFTCVSYVICCVPKYPRFGVGKIYEYASKLFDMTSEPVYSDEEIWNLAVTHTGNLIVNEKNEKEEKLRGKLCVTGLTPIGRKEDGTAEFGLCGGYHELGWCGQNSTIILAYITDYVRNGNRVSLSLAEDMIDTWLKYGSAENGWLASHIVKLDDCGSGNESETKCRNIADTVNTGYGAMQLMNSAELLRKNGIEKPELMKCVLSLCDLYVSLYDEEKGMPSAIAKDGCAVSYTGTGGLFAGYALTNAYKFTKDKRYLELAKKLVRYYESRYLDIFACAAGALDTSCVDKESCCPFLYIALDLYELTGEPEWLEVAERAAIYISTWMFTFDVVYPENSNFEKMGFHTKGGTVVSTRHQHIDPWGGVIAADIARYAKHSGNDMYRVFAELMWNNAMTAISDGTTRDSRGNLRPRGSQAEAYMHTHWYFDETADEKYRFGYLNDWLVAWPSAHRMATLIRKWNGEISF